MDSLHYSLLRCYIYFYYSLVSSDRLIPVIIKTIRIRLFCTFKKMTAAAEKNVKFSVIKGVISETNTGSLKLYKFDCIYNCSTQIR